MSGSTTQTKRPTKFNPNEFFTDVDGLRYQKGTLFDLHEGKWVPHLAMTDSEKYLADTTFMVKRGVNGYGTPER